MTTKEVNLTVVVLARLEQYLLKGGPGMPVDAAFLHWLATHEVESQAYARLSPQTLGTLLAHSNYHIERLNRLTDDALEVAKDLTKALAGVSLTNAAQRASAEKLANLQQQHKTLAKQGAAARTRKKLQRLASLEARVRIWIDREPPDAPERAKTIQRRVERAAREELIAEHPKLGDKTAKHRLDDDIRKLLGYEGEGLLKKIREIAKHLRTERQHSASD